MSKNEAWQRMNKEERLRHQLELQSRQIERVFSTHQVSARVAGGQVETQSIRFDLQSHLEAGLHRLRSLKQDLLLALGVADVSLVKDEVGQWRLDIVRPHEPPVALLDLLPHLPELSEGTAVLGMDEEGAPLLLPFTDPNMTHVLVTGSEGAGKTSLLRTIAVSLAMTNRQSKLQLMIIDPDQPGESNRQLAPLMFLPHLLSEVIADPNDALHALQMLADEMQYRLKHETMLPMIVTLVDNADTLLNHSAEGQAALASLLQRGAEAGIHLVVSSNDPTAQWLSRVMRANLPLRLVGQVQNEAESLAATAVSGAEADYLLGEGDFLAVIDEDQVHFQAAFIGNYDLHMTLETILRNRPRPLLAQPLQAVGTDTNDNSNLFWQREDDDLFSARTTVEMTLDENESAIIANDEQEDD